MHGSAEPPDSTATHLAGLGRAATFTTGWDALGVGAMAAIGGARGNNLRADRHPGVLFHPAIYPAHRSGAPQGILTEAVMGPPSPKGRRVSLPQKKPSYDANYARRLPQPDSFVPAAEAPQRELRCAPTMSPVGTPLGAAASVSASKYYGVGLFGGPSAPRRYGVRRLLDDLVDDLDCLNYLTDRAELGPPASGFVGPHNEASDGPAAGGWAA